MAKRRGRGKPSKQPLRGEMATLRAIGIAPKVPKPGHEMKATGRLRKPASGPAGKLRNRPLLGLV